VPEWDEDNYEAPVERADYQLTLELRYKLNEVFQQIESSDYILCKETGQVDTFVELIRTNPATAAVTGKQPDQVVIELTWY
jgi:hypothetical protein